MAIGSYVAGLVCIGIIVECSLDTRRRLEIIDYFQGARMNYHTDSDL